MDQAQSLTLAAVNDAASLFTIQCIAAISKRDKFFSNILTKDTPYLAR